MVARREIDAVDVRELQERTRDVLRRVQEKGEIIDVSEGDVVIARIVPAVTSVDHEALEEWWRQVDQLAEEIAESWPEGVSAAEAVAEQRREL
ncbi:MAG TPA: hypothetical protein VH482_01985 [Thermomicrobiales bacterium]